MKLTFLGTRGYIEARTRRHRRHTALMVTYQGRRLVIDWGEDWHGQWSEIPRPRALLVTHAHPDHVAGLQSGAPCPVHATSASWKVIGDYPLHSRHHVGLRKPFEVAGIRCEAFGVQHSLRAPAVGYRLSAGRATVFYVPDLVFIRERAEALRGVDCYIGDGATLETSFVRRRGDSLIGHTPVRTQLTWCQKEGVPRAIITHCGAQIVEGDERKLGAELRKMARERGVHAEIAYDGLEVVLR